MAGSIYFVTMIDDKSRYVYVYLLNQKSEVLAVLKYHFTMVERKTDRKVKTIRSDNGTEYYNKKFGYYLK